MNAGEIIGTAESETIEFKREVDSKGGYLEAVVALLNTEGGTIYFGVEEKGGVATGLRGIEDPDAATARLVDTIADRVVPRPRFDPPRRLTGPGGEVVLALSLKKSRRGPHAVRDGARHAAYQREVDRNRPLSWAEITARQAAARVPAKDELDSLIVEMVAARTKFLGDRQRTTLRVACWPHPAESSRIDIRDASTRAALSDGGVVGVRDSGWNYLSSSGPRIAKRVIETGRAGDPTYRHLRVAATGRVEFETDRDELWSWHAHAVADVVDPFVLTEYPVSVLRLAAWLYARSEPPPASILIEIAIRNVEGARLGRGRPDRVPFMMLHDWQFLDESDLCVPATGPLVVPADEFNHHPDGIAFRLIREAYEAWGFEADDVPFYDEASERFEFPG